jgi:carboxypeptidase C (cathepsin A)
MKRKVAMRASSWLYAGAIFAIGSVNAFGAEATKSDPSATMAKPNVARSKYFTPEESRTNGSVRIGGQSVAYDAIAGTLVVHPQGWDDVPKPQDESSGDCKPPADCASAGMDDGANPTAEASMFYVAYLKAGADPQQRPIMFLYNGGPGSSTVWLHMGAFGPKRVVTASDTHLPAAPYKVVDNDASLLDFSDLVFIDAPGTGFSRIAGKDKEKAFWGVDQDAYAFSEFITTFLSKYGRWNSPKYLFGESYGTTRNAALINLLETQRSLDFNGVIMLSQILNFDLSPDGPEFNPAMDLPYQLALPTYAASAWYHHKVSGSTQDLKPFLAEVEHFAMTDYALALLEGKNLSASRRSEIAGKLHDYTGLPVDYILKADLRINGGEFEKNLQDADDATTGRLDTRFSGPSMDPLSKEADYDPQAAAISSAYVSAFNDYVRRVLKFGEDKTFKPGIPIWKTWDFGHVAPGMPFPIPITTNVMPDLATAMKYNPQLQVQLHAGYFDLATPFYEGVYELEHLQIPAQLQANIDYQFYESGHMIYAHEESRQPLHDSVAAFVAKTSRAP